MELSSYIMVQIYAVKSPRYVASLNVSSNAQVQYNLSLPGSAVCTHQLSLKSVSIAIFENILSLSSPVLELPLSKDRLLLPTPYVH